MSKRRQPLPETIALARSRDAVVTDALSADAIIARTYARALFRALRERVGNEVAALFAEEREGRIIADPAFDAADRLYRKSRIYVEPVARSFFAVLFEEAAIYRLIYPDGTQRHVAEADLLAMAGIEVPA
ncbi:MAG: hypothetical protein HEQ22_03385 [Sphingopyxis sp.]|uniref:hypothetical protein n=1 Tax=Sphingopyxis sp. TaxID=1908224 RepID=UPI003D80C1ED